MFFDSLFDSGSEDEAEEEVEEKTPIKAYTADLEDAFRKEKMDLMKNHQKGKALELEGNKAAILIFLDGAQQKLHGCNTTAPVRSFLRERIEATAPFFYLPGDRPLSDEQWNFLLENQNSVIRILYQTFSPYAFPALLLINEFAEALTILHTEVNRKLQLEFQNRTKREICDGLGQNYKEVASFVKTNPAAELNDRRLMKRVEERLGDLVGGDSLVRDMLDALPPGLMTFSMRGLAETLEEVQISASRENSPERRTIERQNEGESDEEEEGEEEDYQPLQFDFAPHVPSTKSQSKRLAQPKSILKQANKTWYRSDETPVKHLPFFGRISYMEYSANKKKVAFKSDFPTECLVYYIDRRYRGKFDMGGHRTGLTWGLRLTYDEFMEGGRYPIRDLGRPSSAHTYKGLKRSSVRNFEHLTDEKSKRNKALWKRQFPTRFLKLVPLRDNLYKGTGGTAREIPAHDGKRDKDLRELTNTEPMLDYYYERMAGFEFEPFRKVAEKDEGVRPIPNNVYGILILTDSVFEDVNPTTLLNAALFAFPPPMEPKHAIDMLVDQRELTDGIRDVVLSWGFEQLLVEREAVDAFASLALFAMTVKALLEEIVMRMQEERVEWDEVTMPRIWLFTIPEEPYIDAPLLKKYNLLIRRFCEDQPEFHLIDWANAWSVAPWDYRFPMDESRVSITERSLQLFFRLCRQEMDLLYRRPAMERVTVVERANLGPAATGPWLKYLYQMFDEDAEEVEDDGDEGAHPWEETMETAPQFEHARIEKTARQKKVKIEPES